MDNELDHKEFGKEMLFTQRYRRMPGSGNYEEDYKLFRYSIRTYKANEKIALYNGLDEDGIVFNRPFVAKSAKPRKCGRYDWWTIKRYGSMKPPKRN